MLYYIVFIFLLLFLRLKFITSRNPSPRAIVSSYIFCFFVYTFSFFDQVSV